MKKIIVFCDCPARKVSSEFEALELHTTGQGKNLEVKIRSALQDGPERILDLLEIASYVYSADTRINRGTETDIFGLKWTRHFHFVIRVRDIAFWSNTEVKQSLTDCLEFLTGDTFEFEFENYAGILTQTHLKFDSDIVPYNEADTIVCFSGGIDSLAATIMAVESGRTPLLISHISTRKLHGRIDSLCKELRNQYDKQHFPSARIEVTSTGEPSPKDANQRSRAFLYLSLAIGITNLTKSRKISLSDNGVVSLNLPKLGTVVGTRASRSTHPGSIRRFQNLARMMFNDSTFQVVNDLVGMTKGEVMKEIERYGRGSMIEEAISCSHTRASDKLTPHCGECSQCVDRRISSIAVNLKSFDSVNRYKKDIVLQSVSGDGLTYAQSYVSFADKIVEIQDENEFFQEFSELDYAIDPDFSSKGQIEEYFDLHQRHAVQVQNAIERIVGENATVIAKHKVASGSLLEMICNHSTSLDNRKSVITSVARVLRRGLPPIFQSKKPLNEHEVQDAMDGLLKGHKEKFDREVPLLGFAGVGTKPDFSTPGNHKGWIYIEAKYPSKKTRLNSIIGEITNRAVVYIKQGAVPLFAVYDPDRFITDDDKFVQDLCLTNDVFIEIVR